MQVIPKFQKTVAFSDTDMAGIVHFSRILCYIEEAEHLAMSKIGVPAADKNGGFPKVHVECDYRVPLRFQDKISVDLALARLGDRSLTWHFVLRVGEQVSAEGKVITVYVNRSGVASDISIDRRALLEPYQQSFIES